MNLRKLISWPRVGLGTSLVIQMVGLVFGVMVISFAQPSSASEERADVVQVWVPHQLFKIDASLSRDTMPEDTIRFHIFELSKKYDILDIEIVSESITDMVKLGGGSHSGWGTVLREKYALVTVRLKLVKPKS